jgi:5-formyltetrahydrofolate cyclo-ligase
MNKSKARQKVWAELVKIARPDSRFHLDFNEYIPDFEGSLEATERLTSMEIYKNAQTLFITPDNCLELLRAQAVRDGKTQIVSTYGIRRGLIELKPEAVPSGVAEYAALLDSIETIGRHISLRELKARYSIDLIVTGASVVNHRGVRFGKGHGFFDLEWAFLYQLGVVDQQTPMVAFVHDCQVVEIDLDFTPFDTICDYIITPTQMIRIENPQKPATGIIWEKLEAGMFESIPPLQELKQLEEEGII